MICDGPAAVDVPMLNEDQARALWLWVVAANGWAKTSQSLVGDATELATVSRDLADRLVGERGEGVPSAAWGADSPELATKLRTLATDLEDQTAELRDRYLATAANIDEYQSILD